MSFKWRDPLTTSKVRDDEWSQLLEVYQSLDQPQEHQNLESAMKLEIFRQRKIQAITDAYAFYRWGKSAKLTFRATRRIVELLSSTYFENIRVEDIYLPDPLGCMEVIPEDGDPILQHNLIFICPDPALPIQDYIVISGTNADGLAMLTIDGNATVGDAEKTLDPRIERQVDPRYLAVLAAIGFLADSDELGLIRHEVLNRDRDRYEKAIREKDEKLIQFLRDRAIRRGKNERIIDTFSLEIGESEPPNEGASPHFGGSKRPHIRRGHFRAVRHGEGRRRIKMKWIPPVVVRRDLLSDNQ